jgi:hypothetical protein
VVYVGYPQMPDFLSWSGPGRNFRDIEPDKQPPSRLMHATFLLPEQASFDDIELETVQEQHIIADQPMDGRRSLGLSKQHKASEPFDGQLSNPLTKPALPPSVRYKKENIGTPSTAKTVRGSDEDDWSTDNMYHWHGSKSILAAHGSTPHLPPGVRFSEAGMTCEVARRVLEFPRVNPLREGKPCRWVFGAAALHPWKNRPQQALAVYDLHKGQCDHWSRGWHYYVGEPEFVPTLPQHRRDYIERELDGALISHNRCQDDAWHMACAKSCAGCQRCGACCRLDH